jgi:CheY-like chemotaxis protein
MVVPVRRRAGAFSFACGVDSPRHWARLVIASLRQGPVSFTHPRNALMMVLDHSVVPAVVLVVEDEMLLRMRAVDMVEDAGYTPVEAVDADEAVAILEARSDIALLFTDIQMPGSMDGLGLAHAVHERWPPIKIILVSGQLKPANLEIPANSRFFGKPLEAKVMIALMQSMIGRA